MFFYFTFKNRNKITSSDQEVSANWGTLFYEFNNDKGLGSSQYYFYFFARRILYMMIQFFLQDDPIVQLTLNIVLSVTVRLMQNFVYLATFRPFSETILNVSNLVSEFGIFMIFSLCAINLMKITQDMHDNIDDLLVTFITLIMSTQMASSVLVFLKTVVIILRKKMAKKVVPINMNFEETVEKQKYTNSAEIFEKVDHKIANFDIKR